MGTLVLVQTPPQKLLWKVVVDGRNIDSEQELLDWIRNSCSGACHYTVTRFADHTVKRVVHNRTKNFTGGYLQYAFWFAKKGDAALCRMFWELAA